MIPDQISAEEAGFCLNSWNWVSPPSSPNYPGSLRPKLLVSGFRAGCTQLLRHRGRIPGVHYLHYLTTPHHTTSHDIIPHLIILSHDIVSHHIIPHFQHLTKMIDFWQLRLGQHCRPLKMSDDSLIAKKYIGSLSLVNSLASHVYDVLCQSYKLEKPDYKPGVYRAALAHELGTRQSCCSPAVVLLGGRHLYLLPIVLPPERDGQCKASSAVTWKYHPPP